MELNFSNKLDTPEEVMLLNTYNMNHHRELCYLNCTLYMWSEAGLVK